MKLIVRIFLILALIVLAGIIENDVRNTDQIDDSTLPYKFHMCIDVWGDDLDIDCIYAPNHVDYDGYSYYENGRWVVKDSGFSELILEQIGEPEYHLVQDGKMVPIYTYQK